MNKLNDILIKHKNNVVNYIKDYKSIIYYAELYNKVIDLSRKICNLSSAIKKPVLVYLPNGIEYIVAYFSILFADKVVLPLYIKSTKHEIISMINYSETEMIITDSEHLNIVLECKKTCKYKVIVYNIETNIVYDDSNKQVCLRRYKELNNVAIMLSTSGTTQKPKRVMLTHKNLLCNIESVITSLKLTRDDKVLISLPMCFGYCNTAQLLTHVYLGTSIVIMPEPFLARTFFKLVDEERIKTYTCVPTNMHVILNYNNYKKYDVSSLRYFCYGGMKVANEVIERLARIFIKTGFISTYGQTEASPRITMLESCYITQKSGSVGKAIPNVTIHILNESGDEALSYQAGEIVVKGNNIMKGYFKAKEETNNVIKGGWLYTGDIGYFDNEGFLYLIGRKRNIIKSGGLNIYPEEVEEIIKQIPGVVDAMLVARPDSMLGEVPHAVIVCNSLISKEKIFLYCKEKLAMYKVPKSVEFRERLNKTYNGKIIRR